MFNLIIDDFYCNKGTWKCIMLNGDLGDKDDFLCLNHVKNLPYLMKEK